MPKTMSPIPRMAKKKKSEKLANFNKMPNASEIICISLEQLIPEQQTYPVPGSYRKELRIAAQ